MNLNPPTDIKRMLRNLCLLKVKEEQRYTTNYSREITALFLKERRLNNIFSSLKELSHSPKFQHAKEKYSNNRLHWKQYYLLSLCAYIFQGEAGFEELQAATKHETHLFSLGKCVQSQYYTTLSRFKESFSPIAG
ncbi:hypothetical protein M513_00815 [Trichuris suis]|uniref:Uncharacterized protein n=1 Tax=Trichuris suis TaxID=68888 RepID=A0A085MMZ3_9BILA|nr:hypothetical protein M513_00815 [Trichuris suis]